MNVYISSFTDVLVLDNPTLPLLVNRAFVCDQQSLHRIVLTPRLQHSPQLQAVYNHSQHWHQRHRRSPPELSPDGGGVTHKGERYGSERATRKKKGPMPVKKPMKIKGPTKVKGAAYRPTWTQSVVAVKTFSLAALANLYPALPLSKRWRPPLLLQTRLAMF